MHTKTYTSCQHWNFSSYSDTNLIDFNSSSTIFESQNANFLLKKKAGCLHPHQLVIFDGLIRMEVICPPTPSTVLLPPGPLLVKALAFFVSTCTLKHTQDANIGILVATMTLI